MFTYLLTLTVSFLVAGACSYALVRWAPKLRLMDHPTGRKIHEKQKPLGGLAVFIGFFPIALYFDIFPLPFLIGLALVTLLGLTDDLNYLDPKTKLFVQISAALLPLITISLPPTSIGLPALGSIEATGPLNFVLLLFWLVGGTNAVNLIDGLDGLATGLGLLIISFLGLSGELNNPALTGGLTGSLAGFLVYNFHPAKLFLGDAGSYFLGFLLSFSTLKTLEFRGTGTLSWPLLGGIILLGIPIGDTVWAIFRRGWKGRGIMSPDKNHIHHLLLEKMGPKKAAGSLYLTQILLCLLTYFYLFSAG